MRGTAHAAFPHGAAQRQSEIPPAVGAGAWSRRCVRLARKAFVPAGFLIAAVSCSDAVGFNEQSAEVEFETERTYEFQFFNLNLDMFRARSSLTVAQRYGWEEGTGTRVACSYGLAFAMTQDKGCAAPTCKG